MEHNESSQSELESTLKDHANKLVNSLEHGNFADAIQVIYELNQVRDRGLYQEVGKLTRELHNAIVNFQIDIHGKHAQEMSQINDATHRLNYVVDDRKSGQPDHGSGRTEFAAGQWSLR